LSPTLTRTKRRLPVARHEPAWRRAKKAEAALLWAAISLGGVVILAAFVLWHLSRRGRLIRDRLGPPAPRSVEFDDVPDRHAQPPQPES
jgi:hypothetical protein